MCNNIKEEYLKNTISNYLKEVSIERLESTLFEIENVAFYNLVIIKAHSITIDEKVFQLPKPIYFITFKRYGISYNFQIEV